MKKMTAYKIISFVVAHIFLVDSLCFGLAPAPGSTQASVRIEMHAAGQKRLTVKVGPGAIPWNEYVKSLSAPSSRVRSYVGFHGNVPKSPNGFEFVDMGTYTLPFGMTDYIFQNYSSGGVRDRKSQKVSLVKAFEYFRDMEAKIPADELMIKEGYFPVDEANGEVGIARIEEINGKRTLILHHDFIEKWNDIFRNDIWFKYKFPDGQTRLVSVAWAVFFRVAKHEMTDLAKKDLLPKGKGRGHLMARHESEGVHVSEDEFKANQIGGRFNIVNDAVWMWFLGSFSSSDVTRYNNDIFRERLNWFFDNGGAELKLNEEFPNLISDITERGQAIDLACIINSKYFGHREASNEEAYGAGVSQLRRRHDRNHLALADIVADYLVGVGMVSDGEITDSDKFDTMLWDVVSFIQRILIKAIIYKIDNSKTLLADVSVDRINDMWVKSYQSELKHPTELTPDYSIYNSRWHRILTDNIADRIERCVVGFFNSGLKESDSFYKDEIRNRAQSGRPGYQMSTSNMEKIYNQVIRHAMGYGLDGLYPNDGDSVDSRFKRLVLKRAAEKYFKKEYEKRMGNKPKVLPATGSGGEDADVDGSGAESLRRLVNLFANMFVDRKVDVHHRSIYEDDPDLILAELGAIVEDTFERGIGYVVSKGEVPSSVSSLDKIHVRADRPIESLLRWPSFNEGHLYEIKGILIEALGAVLRDPDSRLYALVGSPRKESGGRPKKVDTRSTLISRDDMRELIHDTVLRAYHIDISRSLGQEQFKELVKTRLSEIRLRRSSKDSRTTITEVPPVKRAGAETAKKKIAVKAVSVARTNTVLEIISTYSILAGLGEGPGTVTEPSPDEIALFYPVFDALKTQRVEIFLPQHLSSALTESVTEELKALNRRLRQRSGGEKDAISITSFNASNLKVVLSRKSDDVKRIFVNDSSSAEWFKGLLESGNDADIELLKGTRTFTAELPQGKDDIENSVNQAWLIKVSTLAALLNENNRITVGSTLADELDGRLEGNVDEYVNRLAREADTSPQAIAERIGYFLGKIIKLTTFLGEQLRILKAFWIAA